MTPSITSYPVPREWPPSRAPWRPEAGRAALLIHGMQDCFVRCYPRALSPISVVLENVARLAARCRALAVPIFHACQPEGHAIVRELAPHHGDTVIRQPRYSAFQRTELLTMLRARRRDQLLICGLHAHTGCLLTAADAFANSVQAFLVSDGVADLSAHYHAHALGYAAERCAVTLDSAALLHALEPAGH